MTARRVLLVLIMLAAIGAVGWQLDTFTPKSTIVVRYAEPSARGPGALRLLSCGVRVEDAGGKVLERRQVKAKPAGGEVRTVRIEMSRKRLALAQRVLADCTDAAGRTSDAATYALAPTRKPITRVASGR